MTTPVFNPDKSVQAVLYVANRLERRDFHKIFKVLYFADREHLTKYGRPITGDTYMQWNMAPCLPLFTIFLKGSVEIVINGRRLMSLKKCSESKIGTILNLCKMLIYISFQKPMCKNSMRRYLNTDGFHGMK